jgi:cyclophilin family peptidyl-prolyl cis-trans isomerase
MFKNFKKFFFILIIFSSIFILNSLIYGEEIMAKIDKSTETISVEKTTIVKIETNKGDISIELFNDKAPITVANFLEYAKKGFYDGTIFHRVIKNFMIQGGGMTSGLVEKKDTFAPITNEAKNGLKNKKGTIAMARTSVINSATCQFFINLVDNGFLDYQNDSMQGYGYAVFGKVVEGIEVVEAIGNVKTQTVGYYGDVPKDEIIIKKVIIGN